MNEDEQGCSCEDYDANRVESSVRAAFSQDGYMVCDVLIVTRVIDPDGDMGMAIVRSDDPTNITHLGMVEWAKRAITTEVVDSFYADIEE